MLGAYFSAGGPGLLIQIHGIMDSIKYQQIKKSKPDPVMNQPSLSLFPWPAKRKAITC